MNKEDKQVALQRIEELKKAIENDEIHSLIWFIRSVDNKLQTFSVSDNTFELQGLITLGTMRHIAYMLESHPEDGDLI